jgi:ribosomal protein S27AE
MGLRHSLQALRGWLFRTLPTPPPPSPPPEPTIRPYIARKKGLPNRFTSRDWDIALDYWGHKCAVCGRPRGLWHTLAQDHWIPLTHPDCPGTLPTNILPLCHGTDGCNNSKGKKHPVEWLEEKLGKRRARRKLEEIRLYFDWVHRRSLGCPVCGGSISAAGEMGDQWQCDECHATWDDALTADWLRCPRCGCWLSESQNGFYCPRCDREYLPDSLPGVEFCPNCQTGILDWYADDNEGFWRCRKCGAEWEAAD